MSRTTRQKILDSKFIGNVLDMENRYFINKGHTVVLLMNDKYNVANWDVKYKEDISEYDADGRPVINRYGMVDWAKSHLETLEEFWESTMDKTMDYRLLCTVSKDDIVAVYRERKELYRQNKNEKHTIGYNPLNAWKVKVCGQVLDVRLVYDAFRAIEDKTVNIYIAKKKYSPVMFRTQYGTACVFPIMDNTDNEYPTLA